MRTGPQDHHFMNSDESRVCVMWQPKMDEVWRYSLLWSICYQITWGSFPYPREIPQVRACQLLDPFLMTSEDKF